jgi:hypothetical protein
LVLGLFPFDLDLPRNVLLDLWRHPDLDLRYPEPCSVKAEGEVGPVDHQLTNGYPELGGKNVEFVI